MQSVATEESLIPQSTPCLLLSILKGVVVGVTTRGVCEGEVVVVVFGAGGLAIKAPGNKLKQALSCRW